MKPLTVLDEAKGVSVGQVAPDFTANDLDGKPVSVKALIGGRKALLLFYRGGWCPFCNQQLAAISQDSSKFKELDAAIVAVSGEEVEKRKELLRKLNLPFALLSDTKFEGIDRYGVRDTKPSLGVTQLSKPSAFIIDRWGTVSYKYVGAKASDRPKNEELLRALAESDRPMEPTVSTARLDALEFSANGEPRL
ncbi:MAG: redoxin domain-containing protein [Thaumarchaeota archaeon]|nr:redoxin domain-containing protein [Nitrososphaerota archaeon]